MEEFKFVIRCFLVTCLLFALSQYKSDGITVEARVHDFLISTPVADFINNTAKGGVKVFQKSTEEISKMIYGESRAAGPSGKVATKRKQTNTEDIDLNNEDTY